MLLIHTLSLFDWNVLFYFTKGVFEMAFEKEKLLNGSSFSINTLGRSINNCFSYKYFECF